LAKGHTLKDKRPLISVTLIAMILSLSELYVFLGLPIHVVRNGSFDEGLNYWNAEMIEGEELVNVSLGDGSNQHPSENFHCTLTLSRINMTWPPHNYIWVKMYQLLSEHTLVESSTLKFRMMITKTDFERLSSESDAVMIYVGFMISRGLEKKFLVYAWVLFETSLTRITVDTFNELAFWRIARLEKSDQRLSENFEITSTTSIWKDLENQENWVGGDWKIGHERAEGIEVGIMLWNVETSDLSWRLNVYLGHLDITYYWLDNLMP
jgi:hypothetical protein